MRRIIERVVTVVTTTTWKISWEADPPPTETDSVPRQPPQLEASSASVPGVLESKEADLSEEKKEPDPS